MGGPGRDAKPGPWTAKGEAQSRTKPADKHQEAEQHEIKARHHGAKVANRTLPGRNEGESKDAVDGVKANDSNMG